MYDAVSDRCLDFVSAVLAVAFIKADSSGNIAYIVMGYIVAPYLVMAEIVMA